MGVAKEEIIRKFKEDKAGFALPFNTKVKAGEQLANYSYK